MGHPDFGWAMSRGPCERSQKMTCFRIQSTNYSTQNLIDKVKLQFLTSNFGWRKSIILTWTLKTHKLHIQIRSAGYKNVKKSNMTIKVLCTQSEKRLEFMFYTIILYFRSPLLRPKSKSKI